MAKERLEMRKTRDILLSIDRNGDVEPVYASGGDVSPTHNPPGYTMGTYDRVDLPEMTFLPGGILPSGAQPGVLAGAFPRR